MQNIKVSVVVSIYNHDKIFLEKCIESLHTQNLKEDIEFILVDNGATKDSKEIIAHYEKIDNRFKIIRFKQNLGYAKALNTAIEQAQGEYIAIVESDDYVKKDIYEKLYKRITQFNADVCIAGFYVQIDGINYEDNPHNKQIFANSDDTKLFSILDYPFLFTTHPSIWAKLYKAEFLKQIKFDEKGQYIDSQFIADLYSRTNKIIALKEPVYHYQCSNPNASQSNQRRDAQLMRILDDWTTTRETLKKYNTFDKLKEEFYYQSIKAAYRFYKNILPKHRKTFYNKWKKFAKELENDNSFTFKYFNPEQKEFLQNVLKNNYKGTLKYIPENDKKLSLENIFSVKNDKNKKHKVINILGIKIKFQKKQKNNDYAKIIGHQASLYFLQKSNMQAMSIHPQSFLPYKGIYSNKSLAVIGSGPSLTYYNKNKNLIHIGVNRSFLKENLNLDYLFIQDYLKGKDDMKKANNYNPTTCTKFYGILPENRYNQFKKVLKKITNTEIIKANAKPYILEDCANRNWANLLEIEPIGDWQGCIFSALQFALYTNPQKLYLIGCDCSNNGHFHSERIEVANSSSLSYQLKSWQAFKNHIARYYPDVEVISVNPVGLKGMFKDVYTQSYVDEHPELLKENIEILDTEKMEVEV